VSKPRVVFIMGPTASGKTDLGLRLADQRDVSLISVDSALIYRQMDIGTAKPDAEILKQYPHALIDILDPIQAYSAADFVEDATREINLALEQNRVPVLVGGTILYFKALAQGLAKLPEADPELRGRLEAEAAERGWPAMHAKLAQLDPLSGARLKPMDSQRIQRALEVVILTGRSIESFWQEQGQKELPWELLPLALMPTDRAELHRRIRLRYDLMLEEGFQAEVEALRARGDLHLGLPSMRCVGYRQMWQHLDGDLTAAEMVEKSVVATRQLAKRQMTWLRSWDGAVQLDPLDKSQDLVAQTLRQI
jgi:tRNA dimethylallyltransferase